MYVCTQEILSYFQAFAKVRLLKRRSHLVQAALFLQGVVHRAEGTRAVLSLWQLPGDCHERTRQRLFRFNGAAPAADKLIPA